jgi:hypothetical protein
MHARELADLAASPAQFDKSLETYWTASRCRLDRWSRELRRFSPILPSQLTATRPNAATRLVEEILVSEILTRCLAAVYFAHDHYHQRSEAEPIGRNVLAGHLDARRRALRLIVPATHLKRNEVDPIVPLQRRCECWTDLLLAYLLPLVPVEGFAPNAARAQDFAADARSHLSSASFSAATMMLTSGIRSSLEPLVSDESPNGDLNLQIAATVLAAFEPETFDSYGLLRSVWQERLQSVPDETLALLDNWIQPAAKTPADDLDMTPWRRQTNL